MFENMFGKALKQVKRLTMLYAREKRVDKDAICPINVMSSQFNQLFLRPQYCKPRSLEDSTDNCIIVPRKCISED